MNADLFLAISYDKIRQVMAQNIQLKIYSPQGYLLFSNSYYAYEAGITNFTVSEADINKGHLSNGLYLYMIQTETFHIGGQLLLN